MIHNLMLNTHDTRNCRGMHIKLSITYLDQNCNPNAAYPLVITTLGEMDDFCKDFLLTLYSKRSASEFYRHWRQRKRSVQTLTPQDANHKRKTKLQLDTLPNMRVQGVALGTAYASPLTGDTVASVLVGGVVTVMNGAFPMHTGDQVQWYFDFEEVNFRLDSEIGNISNAEYAIGSRKAIKLASLENKNRLDTKSDLQKRKRDYFDAHVSGQSTNSIERDWERDLQARGERVGGGWRSKRKGVFKANARGCHK